MFPSKIACRLKETGDCSSTIGVVGCTSLEGGDSPEALKATTSMVKAKPPRPKTGQRRLILVGTGCHCSLVDPDHRFFAAVSDAEPVLIMELSFHATSMRPSLTLTTRSSDGDLGGQRWRWIKSNSSRSERGGASSRSARICRCTDTSFAIPRHLSTTLRTLRSIACNTTSYRAIAREVLDVKQEGRQLVAVPDDAETGAA